MLMLQIKFGAWPMKYSEFNGTVHVHVYKMLVVTNQACHGHGTQGVVDRGV